MKLGVMRGGDTITPSQERRANKKTASHRHRGFFYLQRPQARACFIPANPASALIAASPFRIAFTRFTTSRARLRRHPAPLRRYRQQQAQQLMRSVADNCWICSASSATVDIKVLRGIITG
jgi:hypothetical protein